MTRELLFRKESQTESPRFRICPTPPTTIIKFAPLDSCTPAEPRLAGRSREVLCTSPFDLAQGLRECGLNVCAGVWNVKIRGRMECQDFPFTRKTANTVPQLGEETEEKRNRQTLNQRQAASMQRWQLQAHRR